MGTFTALDPFEGSAIRPMSLNGYSYVDGDPVNMVDPTGMTPECECQQYIPDFPDLYQQCLTGTGSFGCKIEIAGIDVIADWWGAIGTRGESYLGFGHLLIIFTSEAGIEYEYRAGPIISPRQHPYCSGPRPGDEFGSNTFGMLCATSLEFQPNRGVDAQFAINLRRQTLMQGIDACRKRSCLDRVVSTINNLQINYAPTPGITDNFGPPPNVLTGANSNTFAMTMVNNCHIPLKEFTNDG